MMQRIFFTVLLLSAAAFFAKNEAWANPNTVNRVVAVVNTDIITQSDLNARFEYMLRTLQKNPSRDEQRLLMARTLETLVDEMLLKQIAQMNNIVISDEAIQQAIIIFEQRNNLPTGTFKRLVAGVEDTARQQIISDLIIDNIIRRDISRRVQVPNTEIDQIIRQLAAGSVIDEWELAQILIADKSNDATSSDAKTLSESLYKRLQAGEDFNALAKDYSDAGGAKEGGYLGWFSETELNPTLMKAVSSLDAGAFSEPTESQLGWHILKVLQKRQTAQIQTEPLAEYRVVALQAGYGTDSKTFEKALRSVKRMSDVERILEKGDEHILATDKNWLDETQITKDTKKILDKTRLGDVSKAIDENGITVHYYVANKREKLPASLLEYRERVRQRLLESRIDLAVRKMMRDLRRQAYVEVTL